MADNKKSLEKKENIICNDRCCPIHGTLSVRGRSFKGNVIRKFPKRVVIEFQRTIFVKKYERYAMRKTRIHARLPECMFNEINLGDYIEVKETRPISKIINFVVIGKASKEAKGAEK